MLNKMTSHIRKAPNNCYLINDHLEKVVRLQQDYYKLYALLTFLFVKKLKFDLHKTYNLSLPLVTGSHLVFLSRLVGYLSKKVSHRQRVHKFGILEAIGI